MAPEGWPVRIRLLTDRLDVASPDRRKLGWNGKIAYSIQHAVSFGSRSGQESSITAHEGEPIFFCPDSEGRFVDSSAFPLPARKPDIARVFVPHGFSPIGWEVRGNPRSTPKLRSNSEFLGYMSYW